ncbi:MAG: thiamine pyrophosphate-dependent enzyme [Opitutales bacterium]|jgi:pyruvate dehydrogenase E1 component alpha subunit
MTKEELIAFEDEIAAAFNTGHVRAPVHLYSGNEEPMIEIFRSVQPQDWVFCSWRSHYQCLLKGVPREQVKAEIMAGHSISLCFPEHRIFSSAIVTGVLPIAVGVALAIKRQGGSERVHCFMGEMTAETGVAHICMKYSRNHQLPIRFIIEDNGKSVCTDTRETWATQRLSFEDSHDPMIVYYRYQTKYPHAGAGVRVQF